MTISEVSSSMITIGKDKLFFFQVFVVNNVNMKLQHQIIGMNKVWWFFSVLESYVFTYSLYFPISLENHPFFTLSPYDLEILAPLHYINNKLFVLKF